MEDKTNEILDYLKNLRDDMEENGTLGEYGAVCRILGSVEAITGTILITEEEEEEDTGPEVVDVGEEEFDKAMEFRRRRRLGEKVTDVPLDGCNISRARCGGRGAVDG